LFDRGVVSTSEPFQKLVNQGMILGELEYTGYQTSDGRWVSHNRTKTDADGARIEAKTKEPVTAVKLDPEAVVKQGDSFVLKADDKVKIDARAMKMSKSRGNVVNPDVVVQEFGADS
ncbi:MAG: leucine--tRNA ligase, partial [Blastopirellula sp. JB062]